MAFVSFSGAGPPFSQLYLMPKSSFGPPGLWEAVRIKAPKTFFHCGPPSHINADTAGVEANPSFATQTRRTPFASAIFVMTLIAVSL